MNRWIIAVIAVLAPLAACTTTPPPPATTPTPSTTPAPTSPATPEQDVRGIAASRLPAWLHTDQGKIAAMFVRAAASPDSRLDHERPTNAWRRAAQYCAPDLAQEIRDQKDHMGGPWWTDLTQHDGWVSISITNVNGETPQDPQASTPDPTQPMTLEVTYTRTYHRRDRNPQKDTKPRTWVVTVHHGKVTDFTPDE